MQVCRPGVLFLAASRVSLSKSESKESVTKLGCPSGACVVAVLSPLRGCVTSHFLPTACAVGCILTPLRGYLLSLCSRFRMPVSYGTDPYGIVPITSPAGSPSVFSPTHPSTPLLPPNRMILETQSHTPTKSLPVP